jgi:prepilin-type N-terminal cleavage/methylation domain-containing protein
MADHPRSAPCASIAGFTLIELMVALGILLFGVSAILGVLGVGVQTRRSAEQRHRAVQVVGGIVHDLEQSLFDGRTRGDAGGLPALDPITITDVGGHTGLLARVTFTTDPEHPELVLARIDVSWTEQGEAQAQTFERILRWQESYPSRVARLRAESAQAR